MTLPTIAGMTLTDYTSYAEIRAVLGVSDEELEDATLALPAYSTDLAMRVYEASPLALPLYTTISGISVGSRTEAQQRYYTVFRLFCSYAVAKHLLTSMELFAYSRLTDGKAEVQRADRFEEARRGVEAGYNTMRYRMLLLLSELNLSATAPTTALPGLVVAAPLGSDPVTGV